MVGGTGVGVGGIGVGVGGTGVGVGGTGVGVAGSGVGGSEINVGIRVGVIPVTGCVGAREGMLLDGVASLPVAGEVVTVAVCKSDGNVPPDPG